MIYKVTSAEYKWVATGKPKSEDTLRLLVVLASTFYPFNWHVGSPIFNGSFQFILCSLLSTIFILLLDNISNEKIFIDMQNILFLLFSSLSLRSWRVPVQSMLSFSRRYFSPTNSIDAHLFFERCYVCCRSFSLNRSLFIFCCLQLKEKKTSLVYFRLIAFKSKRNSIGKNEYVFEVFRFRRSEVLFRSIDSAGFHEALLDDVREGNMTDKCRKYMDDRTFRDVLDLEQRGYEDHLELFISPGKTTLQEILHDYDDIQAIYLRRPAPQYLPIRLSRIADEGNTYIIPSANLSISSIMTRPPRYLLDAVICELNGKKLIFAKNQSTEEWYHYQRGHPCVKLLREDSGTLNDILASRSEREHREWIGDCHFLVSLVLYNAQKYIYIPDSGDLHPADRRWDFFARKNQAVVPQRFCIFSFVWWPQRNIPERNFLLSAYK